MDLFLTVGKWPNIASMLESLDSFEYDFLLEKYRKLTFGPGMVNYMLAQLAWIQMNTFSKSHVKIERLMMGEVGELQASDGDRVAVSLIRSDYYNYYIKEGFSKQEAQTKADEMADTYRVNLANKRLEEEMQQSNSQDLSDASN